MFASRIRKVLAAFKNSPRSHKRRTSRKPLALEMLETRLVPTTFTWSGGGGTDPNWSLGANWQGGVAPTPSSALGGILIFSNAYGPSGGFGLTNDITGLSVAEVVVSDSELSGNAITLTGSGGVGLDSQGTGAVGPDNEVATPFILAGNLTYTLETDNILGTDGGGTSGSARLTINGAGIFNPEGTAPTYTGGTTISGGATLKFLNDINLGPVPASAAPGSLLLDGGTLVDAQTVALAINANRGISIGASGGTLECGRTLTVGGIVAGTGELSAEASPLLGAGTVVLGGGENVNLTGTTAGTGYLQIEAEEAVEIGATAALNVTLGYQPTVGDTYTLIHDDGGSISGTFAGLAQGATLSAGGSTFKISYTGGTGNDVVLTCTAAGKDTTATTVKSSLDSSVYGQAVTFTATVTPGFSSGHTPTGTVTFVDGSTTLGTANVSTTAGVTTATLATRMLAAGTHGQVVAEYSGDSNFVASNSASFTQTVTPAALTITAKGEGKSYGQSLTFSSGSTLFTSSGLQNSETIGSVTLAVSDNGGAAAAGVGDYAITPSVPTGGTFSAGNYAITYDQGVLYISPAPLTVTANAATKVYGTANPSFSVSYAGFVNSDGPGVLPGRLSIATSATALSDVGSFSLTPSGLNPADYTITYVPGTLTITPASQTITWSNPADIVSGTALSSTQLNATVSVVGPALAGALTYDPAAGTVLNTGSGQTLTVVAAATADYTTATDSVTINAVPSVTTTTVTAASTPNPSVYGQAVMFTATVSPASSSVPAPTGTVAFLDGGTTLGTANVSTTAGVTTATLSTSALAAGTHSLIIAEYFGDSNFGASASPDFTQTVTPAPLSVTVNNQTMVYGSVVPTLTGTFSGVVNGDSITVSYSTTATSASDVVAGGYAITASLIDPSGRLSNYTLTNTPGTLTITPASQTITWNTPAAIVYGTPLGSFQLDATGPGGGGALIYTLAAGTVLSAGSNQTLTVNAAATTDYLAASDSVAINVTPAPLSVTPNNLTMIYGSAVPTLTGTLTGVVNGDIITAGYSTTATSSSDVVTGGYPILASLSDPNGRLGNYTVTNTAGTLGITQAGQTITWTTPSAIVYGTALGGAQLHATDAVVGPAAQGVLTYSPAAGTVLNAGSNQTLTVNAAATTDYLAASDTVSINVTPVLLSVTVDNQTMVYGSVMPTLTGALTGVVNGDPITVSYSTTATSTSDVVAGGYAITASLNDPNGRLANYAVSNTPGALTIAKASQTITWTTPASIVYGTALGSSQLDATDTVVGPATAGNLTYTPAAGTVLNAGSSQTLTVNAAATTDYLAASDAVNITVTLAPLSITANNQSMVYGSTVPTLTGILYGVVNGDIITASYSTAATSVSDVVSGGYTINASLNDPNSRLGNYTLSNTPGTLAITQASQTISWATPAAIVYGTTLGSTQLDAANTVVGPAAAGTLTYAPVAGTVLNAGNSQTLTVNAAATTDYGAVCKSVLISVTPAILTVTANNQTMIYGSAVPVLAGTLSGVVNGDPITVSYGTAATSASDVVTGGYAITASLNDPDSRLGNYTVINTPGTLTLTKASQTINWTAPAAIVYGTTLNSAQLNATDTVVGPAAAGTLTYTPTTGTVLNAGRNQTLTVNAAATTDYLAANKSVLITVAPAILTVAANNQTMVYGSAVPTLTGTLSGVVNADNITVSYSTTATSSSNVVTGGYQITASLNDSNGRLANYTLTNTAGTLSITPANQTITWTTPGSIVYGIALGGTQLNATDTVVGPAAAGTLTYTPTAGTVLNAGSNQTLTVNAAATTDYNAASKSVLITVTSALLTVTANNASRVYGAANPSFTDTVTGFVNGDKSTVIGGSAALGTVATTASAPGAYTITAGLGSLTAANYTFTLAGATLIVSQDASTATGSSSTTTPAFGQAESLTATLTASAPGSGTPSGTVDFYDTTTAIELGKVTLSGDVAVLSTANLAPGSNALRLSYSGDGNFLASSTILTITVTPPLLILNATAAGALTLSGNADINVTGSVVVDSNSATALTGSGNASVKASVIDVVGNDQKSGNATFSPAPVTGATVVADPYASLAEPSTAGLTNGGAANVSGNTIQTLSPGVYSQINISGNAAVTLNAGTYVIEGGGFNVSGNATVKGSGVLIFDAGSKYPTTGGTYGAINISGNAGITLTASSTGAYSGIVFFQSRDNAQALQLSGNAIFASPGTVYLPSAAANLSGNAMLETPMVVNELSLSGNSDPSSTPYAALVAEVAERRSSIQSAATNQALAALEEALAFINPVYAPKAVASSFIIIAPNHAALRDGSLDLSLNLEKAPFAGRPSTTAGVPDKARDTVLDWFWAQQVGPIPELTV